MTQINVNDFKNMTESIRNPYVYITNSNLKKIIDKKDINSNFITDYMLASTLPLFKHLKEYFNKDELCHLYIYGEIIKEKDLEKVFSEFLNEKKKQYNPTKAFDGSRASYHRNKECEYLRLSYFNILIPSKVKAKGEVEIKKFKVLVDTGLMRKLARDDIKSFITKVIGNADFLYLTDLDITNNVEEYDNSDVADFDLSKEDIIKSLNDKLREMYYLSIRSEDSEVLFRSHVFSKSLKKVIVNFRTRQDHHLIPILESMNDKKIKIRKLVEKFFVKEFGDPKFSEEALKKIDFKACKSCFRHALD